VDELPDMDVDELQRLLTKAELLDHFALSPAYRKLRKFELAAILRAKYSESRPFHAWCRGSIDRVYHLISRPLCERFRLLFFGNFHQDWTDFVLTDLGLFAYEKIPAAKKTVPDFLTWCNFGLGSGATDWWK
jgi:Fanconi anemia-associated nuclease SAP domain